MNKTLKNIKPTLIFFIPLLLLSLMGEIYSKGSTGFKITDYQKHLNHRFKKEKRLSSQLIVIHTSEAGLESTLRTLSRGKRVGRRRTKGGHAHYAIARNGRVYRILSHWYRANHTGLSMWNGVQDISSHSIGIELVGFHYGKITEEQYRSVSKLVNELQRIYSIRDKNVLTHCQVAYGKPNEWFKNLHRGRKRCAMNFDRKKAGLNNTWSYDPDVRDGRLNADKQIHRIFYAGLNRISKKGPGQPVPKTKVVKITIPKNGSASISNIVSKNNTAWNIAGEDYKSPRTVYILPGNRTIRGDKVKKKIGWNRVPPGTQVLVNQPLDREKKKGPIFLITREYTAWSFAGIAYARPTTIYFLPSNRIISGNQIRDWDEIPDNTRLIIGYTGPLTIEAKRGRTPWGIAGKNYNLQETIYLIPGMGLVTGDQVKNFRNLPSNTLVFIKKN